ncbi:hypothetical protein [Salidesulfovibrio onnuriiensis]|uniref:hypothetical protein n=1 Tax=Salidesulfovibrio onnuriiensis TaxID=2583823 RepID=UPI0011C96160|nr:hypothetical protein [Salidesulfovibrio onnuriiensis]
MKQCLMAMLVACVLVLGFAVVAVNAQSGGDVSAACSSCHNLKRVCLMVGSKDKAGWEKTINRMVANGASVGNPGAMAGYLAGLAPGTGPCQ